MAVVRNVLSLTLISAIIFLTITAEYYATLGPMIIGRIDYVLLSMPCCDTKHRIVGLSDTKTHLGPFDYILWKVMKQLLTRHISLACASLFGLSSGCRQSLDQEYCEICKTYQQYRCHFRADKLLLRRSPWRNEGQFMNISVHSSEECEFSPSRNKAKKRLVDTFKDEPMNVLQTVVMDVENDYHKNYFSTMLDPQPAVEVKDLNLNWHSMFRPVVDVNASGVVAHFVVGYSSAKFYNMPFVWLGNSTLEEVINLVPSPPTQEGLYPRMGIVNITHVTIMIHDLINNSGKDAEDDKLSPTSVILIPDELFLPLLQVTIDAGEKGTDQMAISSMLKEALIMVIRKHILGEAKLRASFDKSTEIIDAIKSVVINDIKKRSNVVNDHLDKANNRVKEVLHNFEEEWKTAVEENNELWKPVFKDMKEGWNEIKRELNNNNEVGGALMDNVEKQMEKKWKRVRKEATQGWGNAKQDIFDKINEISNDLKKSQATAQDSVSPIVSILGEAFFADKD